jgi:hypothetical protein
VVGVRAGQRCEGLLGQLLGRARQLFIDHRERRGITVEDHRQVAGVGADVDDRAEQVLRPGLAGVQAIDPPGVSDDRPGEQPGENGRLRREVVVQRGGRRAKLTGDVGDGRRGVAVASEQLPRDREDALLRVGLLRVGLAHSQQCTSSTSTC